MIAARAPIRQFAVVTTAAILLAAGIDRISIAAAYGDPVAHVRTPDESLYANSALDIARTGRWLTPRVMDRYLLYKPPLLVWSSGLALKLFGISLWALRLPSLLAAIAATLAVCTMAGRFRWIALALLLSSALWHTFAKLCYTDMLLACAIAIAMSLLYRDIAFHRNATLFGFALATAAAIMTKNVAGLIPVLVVLALKLASRESPSIKRILQLCAVIALLAAPWHIYQLLAHREWFIADYIQLQLLAFGLKPFVQYSSESAGRFYFGKLIRIEPLLVAFACVGAPGIAKRLRKRDPQAILVTCWLGIVVGALFAFQYRNAPYLLQLVAPLAVLAARYGPWTTNTRYAAAIALILAAFGFELAAGRHPLAIQMATKQPPPSWLALKSYAALARANDLIIVSPDDEFYSLTLALPKVRNVFLDPDGLVERYAPHYVYLGITMTVQQALQLPSIAEAFRPRLRAWGLDSTEPVGTAIAARNTEELLRFLRSAQSSDIYLPEDFWRQAHMEHTHTARMAAPGRVLALAKISTRNETWRPLPSRW